MVSTVSRTCPVTAWEADREALSAAGVPRWAQVTGADDHLRPRLFVWVDDALALHSQLVGDADPVALRQLVARASEILSGPHAMPDRGRPVHTGQHTALPVVHDPALRTGS